MSKPITLVLGGTGIKGIANIGVLQSLHNHGIKIKKIIAAGNQCADQYTICPRR